MRVASQTNVTLYGKVCFFHLDDVCDEYTGAEERTKLKETFKSQSQPEIIAVTLIAVSDDPRHNMPFVQHVDDKVFLPQIETIMKEKPKGDYARSDGAPTQFDNATQYIWISRSKDLTGVTKDWCLHWYKLLTV